MNFAVSWFVILQDFSLYAYGRGKFITKLNGSRIVEAIEIT